MLSREAFHRPSNLVGAGLPFIVGRQEELGVDVLGMTLWRTKRKSRCVPRRKRPILYPFSFDRCRCHTDSDIDTARGGRRRIRRRVPPRIVSQSLCAPDPDFTDSLE